MRFKLFFGGGEVKAHRDLLVRQGVPNLAVSYFYLRSKLPKTKTWTIEDNFPADASVLLDSGGLAINKKDWSAQDHTEYFNEYLDFVQANLDHITYFTDTDFKAMGLGWVDEQRREIWSQVDRDKFLPVWHPEDGPHELRRLIDTYPNLAVPPLAKPIEARMAGVVRGAGTTLHGLSYNHPYDAPGGLYASVTSTSWISPTKYGETIVWDHGRLRRYPSERKEQARRRHVGDFAAAGFDADAILDDDNTEVNRYTIWAWRQMEEHMQGPERTRKIPRRPARSVAELQANGKRFSNSNGHSGHPVNPDPPNGAVAHTDGDSAPNAALVPASVHLPGFNFHVTKTVIPGEEGEPSREIEQRVLAPSPVSMRQCASCSLSSHCPEYNPERETCAYTFPVEIKTRDQLLAALTTLMATQMQRVGFGRLSEDLQGGYPDANVSAEMDRFFRMVKLAKDIEDNREFLKVNIEARGNAGVLSNLFGSRATEPLRRIDSDKAEDVVREAMD